MSGPFQQDSEYLCRQEPELNLVLRAQLHRQKMMGVSGLNKERKIHTCPKNSPI